MAPAFFRPAGRLAFAVILAALLVEPAAAHHVMDGALPSTFAEGLLSGFGHPIIGLDHLAFVVAVGLASLRCPLRLLMPLVFVAATVAGTGVHLQGLDLPPAEPVIAASVVVIGVLLITQQALSAPILAALFALAGLFHGYAYGESIVGAEPAPLGAYLLGFAAIQYLIAVVAMELVRYVGGKTDRLQALWLRVGGGVVAGMGIVFLAQNLAGA